MSDEKVKEFTKIPNNFFYNNGEILNLIGGRDSFVLYCLLTSRKCMSNKVYISLKEIIRILELEKHVNRSKTRIINSLALLKKEGYIDFEYDLGKIRSDEVLIFTWIPLFPKLGGVGWVKFYEDDFEIHSKIGNTSYVIMWMLRMYVNFETKTSYLSITDMSEILSCNRNNVQNTVHLFKISGLFDIIEGKYYFHEQLGMKIRLNNEYKYNGEIDRLLDMDSDDIHKILYPSKINT